MLTLSVVLKSVFSNSATCSNSSLYGSDDNKALDDRSNIYLYSAFHRPNSHKVLNNSEDMILHNKTENEKYYMQRKIMTVYLLWQM